MYKTEGSKKKVAKKKLHFIRTFKIIKTIIHKNILHLPSKPLVTTVLPEPFGFRYSIKSIYYKSKSIPWN